MAGGRSARQDLYIKIKRNLTNEEVKDLSTYLDGLGLLDAGNLQNATAHDMFNMLEKKGVLKKGDLSLLTKMMAEIGRQDYADEARKMGEEEKRALEEKGVTEERNDQPSTSGMETKTKTHHGKQNPSVANHSSSTQEPLQAYMAGALFVVIAIGIGILTQLYLPAVKSDGNDQNHQKTGTKMSQEDSEKLKQQIETLRKELKERNCIKRCETGMIELQPSSMKNGQGVRSRNETTSFIASFDTKPNVTIGLTMIDHPAAEVRIKVKLVSVSTTGLTVCFTTWNKNSVLHSAIVNWMACA